MKTLTNNLSTLDTASISVTKNRTLPTNSYQWKQLRRSIIERDKFTCQSCGQITTVLEVDHINRDSSNNDPSNLQSLCRPCHEKKTKIENSNELSYQDHLKALKLVIAKNNT